MFTQKMNPSFLRRLLFVTAAMATVAAARHAHGQGTGRHEAPAAERGREIDRAGQDKPRDEPRDEPRAADEPVRLGVTVAEVPPALQRHLRDRLRSGEGVVVTEVEPGSPAEEAGIEPGDILIRMDDDPIHDPTQFAGLLAMLDPDTRIEFTVIQMGERVRVPVAPTDLAEVESPGRDRAARSPAQPASSWPLSVFALRTNDGSVSLTGNGARFALDLQYRDDRGRTRRMRFEGTARQLTAELAQVDDLPDELWDAVASYLESRSVTTCRVRSRGRCRVFARRRPSPR